MLGGKSATKCKRRVTWCSNQGPKWLTMKTRRPIFVVLTRALRGQIFTKTLRQRPSDFKLSNQAMISTTATAWLHSPELPQALVGLATFKTIRKRPSTDEASPNEVPWKALWCRTQIWSLFSITRLTSLSLNRPSRLQRISKRSPFTQTLSTICSTEARCLTSLFVGKSLAASPRLWHHASSGCTCSKAKASAVKTA